MRLLKVAIIIADLAICLFVVSIAYSAASLNFSFPSSIETSTRGSLYVVTAPFSVTNRGYYDVSNLEIGVELTNSTNYMFFKNDTTINDIKAQTTQSSAVVLAVNSTNLYLQGAYYNLFHSDTFRLIVTLKCNYAAPLIGFAANISQSIQWTAPLANFAFAVGTPTPTLINTTYAMLSVPFTISGYDELYFNPTLKVSILDSHGNLVNSVEQTFVINSSSFTNNIQIPVRIETSYAGYTVMVQITSPFSYGPIQEEIT